MKNNLLNNNKFISEIDTKDMYHKIIHMPEHVFMAYNETEPIIPETFDKETLSSIKNVVICGMGGSAVSGDIAEVAYGKNIPIKVVKNYNIPFLDENTLVIIMSYSGNTAETVSCLKQATSITKHIAAVTAGGQVKEIVQGTYPFFNLPAGNPPRSAIAWLFTGLVKILELFDIITDQQQSMKKIIANLVKKAGALCIDCPSEQNIAKRAATTLVDKIPIIYTSEPQLFPLAYRWKCQFNENSKHPAFANTFPEMNHNEIVGWENQKMNSNFIPIILTRFNEKPEYSKRIIAFKGLMTKSKVEYLEFYLEGDSVIEEIFSLIYLGDMISYYLAILKSVNPTDIAFIDYMKNHI